jgi:ABC-type protease/lipase transport system fused ATPase/permease subunit
VVNVLMLFHAVYMLQIYDRALVSNNVTTFLMLTLLMIGLYTLLAMREAVGNRVRRWQRLIHLRSHRSGHHFHRVLLFIADRRHSILTYRTLGSRRIE